MRYRYLPGQLLFLIVVGIFLFFCLAQQATPNDEAVSANGVALDSSKVSPLLVIIIFVIWQALIWTISPCFDMKKMTLNYWTWGLLPRRLNFKEIRDIAHDYHVSVSGKGHISEFFTSRLLGTFGSMDFQFKSRRRRDEFEHLVQAAIEGEPIGNAMSAPLVRLVSNACLLAVVFSFGCEKSHFVYREAHIDTSALQQVEAETSHREMPGGSWSVTGTPMGMSPDGKATGSEEPKVPDSSMVQISEASHEQPVEGRIRPTDIFTEDAAIPNQSTMTDEMPPRMPQHSSPAVTMRNPDAVELKLKTAELQGDLAVINSKIEAERKRWQDANAAINAVTNNKTTPVVRNSPEHVQMYQAQVIMKQVEAGATALKEEKSRLEAMIKSLQDSPPANTR